jgi:ketosteroid isomerase-like protein
VLARRAPLGRTTDPREVLESWRAAAISQSVEDYARLYAADGVHEFPFTAPGVPSRLEGRDAIAAWAAEAWRTGGFEYDRYRTIAIHDTGDPNTIIVEQDALGRSAATGEFALPNIIVLTVRDGQIVRLRDYVDVLAAMTAVGRD